MRTTRHGHQQTRACLLTTAALILAACGTETSDTTPTPAWTYSSTLTATPGPLTPEQPATSTFEDRTEVQIIRQTDAMLVWSNLMDTCDSNEYARLIDPSAMSPCDRRRRTSNMSLERIGPLGFAAISIDETPEGNVEVAACLADQTSSYGDLKTDAVRDDSDFYDKHISVYTLSPLTNEERAEVLATGLEPPTFWVRSTSRNDARYSDEQCRDVEVVIPVFVDWKDTYLFARPYTTRQTVPRDELP